MKRDRELHEPDENHRYLDEAGEKRAEDGCWLEGLPRGGPGRASWATLSGSDFAQKSTRHLEGFSAPQAQGLGDKRSRYWPLLSPRGKPGPEQRKRLQRWEATPDTRDISAAGSAGSTAGTQGSGPDGSLTGRKEGPVRQEERSRGARPSSQLI